MLTQPRLALTLLLLAAAGAIDAQTGGAPQAMTCGPASAGSAAGCDGHHFHLGVYSFETRGWSEAWGVNGFATAAGCEAARAIASRNAETLASFMRAKQPKNPAELLRVGACHCDMSGDKSHSRFLDDAKRSLQIRQIHQLEAGLRERLLDMGATPGSDVVRALIHPPSAFPSGVWSREIPAIEEPRGFVVDPSRVALKDTAVGRETARREQETTIELAAIGEAPPLAPVTAEAGASVPLPETKVESEPEVAPPPAGEAIPATAPEHAPGGDESPADRFISFETARISNILKASEAISDDAVRSRIFESSMARSQVLENLRKIIDGAGARSRLAQLADKAVATPASGELVERLFGPLVAKHWAPADARDVVIRFPPDVAGDPLAILRDTTGHYPLEQRQLALYIALSREALTSRQESWLIGVVESLAR